MIHLTQLIYLKPGQEATFHEFESIAIPLMQKYRGKLLLRIRPEQSSIVEADMETPYEVHFCSFENEADFQAFLQDPERQKLVHLKEASIRSSMLVKGEML